MGPVDHLEIVGAKGGESQPKQAVESPDSLRSTNIAKILLAVGEGEFDGVPTDRDIYLDNTPIADASGNVNFPGVKWEWRPGSVEQNYIQGIPSVENETSVNVELRSDNPFTRALSNTQLSAVRVRMSWPRLAKQESNGDTKGYRIEYAIDIATDGGAYVEAHLGAVDGKSTNGYQRSVRVNLPRATSGWMLRVRRLTPNANSGTVADTMTVAGYTEIIDQKIRYPNTALLYIEFDAQQFQNIPAVTVKCKAKRWPVPSTYDPITRTYSGVWDGTFKLAWTNNPAFVTYGLCVEDRFGLGKRIKPWMVDKWEMYRIAQYCDQLVPNGVGGQEPRFLCDMNLQGRAEAWTLLRDLSAIYRGMVYWAHGSLFMQADMPRAQDIDYVFTRSNVIDGEFVYGGAERSTHYSRALVSYDNPANNYDTDVIPVTDNALQRRYRDRPIELSAIGCTRASEAQRRGKWALLSNSQDRTVTFKTGMEGRIPLPGFVIPVADELVAGRPNGGRISSAAGRVVTLDRDTPIKAGDRLIVNLPNGTAQARTVHSVAGRAVTVTTEYSLQPEPELQWAIDYDDLAIQLFRVLKTTRTQEGSYEITALEFNPSKFAAIDTGAKLDERPISVIPVTTVAPPASVSLSSGHMIDQGIAVSTMTIAWPAVEGAVAYDVEWRKDNGNWIRLQRTGAASVDVVGIYAGAYLARARSVSAFDITSIWKSSDLTQLNGKEGLPPAVTFLTTESLLFGIKVTWGFPAGAEDTQRTELWYSEGTDLGSATKLADLAYPQSEHVMQGLRAGQRFFFWARLVDRSGNVGPFFPVAPTVVTGIASADAGPILEQIKDQITESELGKELTSKIEKIALIDGNGPGSVNERIGTAKTELAKQISDVNNALGTVKGNLEQQITAVSADVSAAKTELQQQIANVSALAGSLPYRKDKAYSVGQSALGSDGKLYQALKAVPLNTPPPNATYWTDVGQAVVTANGMAARVSKVETDVSTLDGKVTAQASQISGLQSSLTTTNGNVSAAQQAAQDAATLAGGKGKVIVQSAAPAVADRLAQNLWIDTTSNANTPKRWSGSAWVAVTDKVATDAAAAAAGALALAQTKADASVVSSLTTRVSDAEGKLTSQATKLEGMQTSIDGKASSQALQQVTSRVTATEDKDKAQDQLINSQSQALTSLTDSVSKKADASTVQALGNMVTQQGQELTAQGQSLTKIDAALGQVGGENLVYNPSFDKEDPATPLVADGWWYDSSGTSVTRVPSLVSSTLAPGLAQHLDVTGLTSSTWARIYGRANRRFKVAPGKTYTASVYLRGTAGLRILPQVYGVSDAGVGSNSWAGVRVDASDTWARLSVTFTADANTAQVYPAFVVYGGASASAGFIEGDQYQIEEGALATGWRDNGQVNSGNQASTATAVEALNAKVTQQGADLASTSSKTTSLENSLNTTNGNVAVAQAAAQNAATLAGSKGRVIVQSAAPDVADRLSQNLWIDTTGNANTPKRWTGTAWQVVTDKVATDAAAAAQSALSQVALKADSSALQTLGSTVSQQGQQIAADGQAITRIDASLNQVKSETASNASATSAITGRVNATEAGLTSVSGQLTEVSNSIGDVGGENLVYNSSFEEQDPGTPGLGNGWWYDGSAGTRVPSLVASTFATGMAQRLDITGLSASTWARLYVKQSMRFKVTPGKTYTASVYVRGTPGLRVLAQVYNLDGSGSNTTSWASARKDAALEWARLSVTFIPTSDTVLLYPAVVVYGGATATSGFIEADHYQVEEGGRATGWRDNGQVIAASNSVTSKAVDSLTSAVNQQGANLSSVSGRTTSLENGLNITNGNLASAQQAAQAAATAAGAKGEVIYSATTPAAEKRLVQNLWIDTTGNANTPKRWSGSAWVAVTDKVATDAAAAAANALAEVAKKADASAVSALNSEVKQQGSLITSQGSSITSLSNSITGLAAAGANLLLDGGFESAPLGAFSGGTVVAANARTGANSLLIAPAAGNADVLVGEFSVSPGRTIYAEAYAKASVVTSGGGSVDLQLQFRTVGQSVAWVSLQLINLSQLGGTFTKLSGTANVPAGYDKCRVYATLRRGADAAARINIDDVFVADVTEAQSAIDLANTKASSSALQSLSSIVSQQGAKIESEAKRTDGLYTSVGNANSAIQDEATTRTNADSALSTRINTAQAKADDALAAAQSEVTARANADSALGKRVDGVQSSLGSTNAAVQQISTAQTGLNNKVNASYSVRLQVVNGNQYVAAGFGVGVENDGGVLQSTFAVMADRFAVLNPSGNGFVSPFAIQNGQVFLNEAFISTATIQRAIVGNSINSSELANNGVPIMRMDFASGTIIMQNKAASAYTVFNRSGIDMVINGIRRIRMGEW